MEISNFQFMSKYFHLRTEKPQNNLISTTLKQNFGGGNYKNPLKIRNFHCKTPSRGKFFRFHGQKCPKISLNPPRTIKKQMFGGVIGGGRTF